MLLFPSHGSRLLRCLCLPVAVLLELWVPQAPLGSVAESQQRAPVTAGMSSLGWEGEMGRAGGDVAVTKDASAVPRACGEPRAVPIPTGRPPYPLGQAWGGSCQMLNQIKSASRSSGQARLPAQHPAQLGAPCTQLPFQRLGAGLHAQLPSMRGLQGLAAGGPGLSNPRKGIQPG